jgi:TonB family protein
MMTAIVASFGSVTLAQDPVFTSKQLEQLPVESKSCKKARIRYRNLESQAIKKVEASYPVKPGFRAAGTVIVKVGLNALGNVTSAHAVCGHPLLMASSVAAAKQWRFVPQRVNGRAVNSVGVITFVFPPHS